MAPQKSTALRKILSCRIKERYLCIALIVVFLFLLIPLLLIAQYAVPCADDFNYGVLTHRAWETEHSVSSVLAAAGAQVADSYQQWQGTFAAIFLMALQPAVFGEQYYVFGPVLMYAVFICGTFFFCWALFRKFFGAGKCQFLILSVVWTSLCLQMPPSALEGFYWFNGSVFYTFFFSISLFFYGLVILYLQSDSQKKKTVYFILLCFLAILIGGSIYTFAHLCHSSLPLPDSLFLQTQRSENLLGALRDFDRGLSPQHGSSRERCAAKPFSLPPVAAEGGVDGDMFCYRQGESLAVHIDDSGSRHFGPGFLEDRVQYGVFFSLPFAHGYCFQRPLRIAILSASLRHGDKRTGPPAKHHIFLFHFFVALQLVLCHRVDLQKITCLGRRRLYFVKNPGAETRILFHHYAWTDGIAPIKLLCHLFSGSFYQQKRCHFPHIERGTTVSSGGSGAVCDPK